MKFTFTCQHEDLYGNDDKLTQIQYVCYTESLADVMENFESFLKGCGFEFENQIIDLVEKIDNDVN